MRAALTLLPARLAVDLSVPGKGIGGILLVAAMQRARQLVADNGDVLLFVDAKDGQAGFYTKYGFTPLLTDPKTRFIPSNEIP